MKVYLSGPMTGVENYKDIFNQYEKRLTDLGFTVFNPAWFDYKKGWSYDEILDLDLAALQKCEAIFMLPGWEKSKGACIEYGYALAKGINIMHVGYLDNAETWEKMHESIFPTCNNVLWKNDEKEKCKKLCEKLWDNLAYLSKGKITKPQEEPPAKADEYIPIDERNCINCGYLKGFCDTCYVCMFHSKWKPIETIEEILLRKCLDNGMKHDEIKTWLADETSHEYFIKKYGGTN